MKFFTKGKKFIGKTFSTTSKNSYKFPVITGSILLGLGIGTFYQFQAEEKKKNQVFKILLTGGRH